MQSSRAPFVGFFFEQVEEFTLPAKLYGSINRNAERTINTYKKRLEQGKSTGILLSGEKGGGKTLLAKKIAMDLQVPVVLVQTPFSDETFKGIIAGLGPSVVIFDEFEKVYASKPDQNQLLTLFDGIYNTQCLFMIIVNEQYLLTDALMNRPSRFYYLLEYKGLDLEFIEDYCQDRLDNKENIQSVKNVAIAFESFNFDMLQSLVEEMNRYNETAQDSVKYLNIKSTMFASSVSFEVTVTKDGKAVKVADVSKKFTGNPLVKGSFPVHLVPTPAMRKAGDSTYFYVYPNNNVVEVDAQRGIYIFEVNGYRVTATKGKPLEWSVAGPGVMSRPEPAEGGDED